MEASIDINFGAYAHKEKYYGYAFSSEETDVYYVIWTGDAYAEDYRYMGIKVPASEQYVMEEIAEATSNGTHVEPVKYTGIIIGCHPMNIHCLKRISRRQDGRKRK